MKITTCEIITALLAEPLQARGWFHYELSTTWDTLVKQAPSCHVCAVGAVLRDRLPNFGVDAFSRTCSRLARTGVGENGHLRMLSDYFELLHSSRTVSSTRERYLTAQFAVERLPAEFEVEL